VHSDARSLAPASRGAGFRPHWAQYLLSALDNSGLAGSARAARTKGGFYDDYEARWRAAGNRSRLVIDTALNAETFQGYVHRAGSEPWPTFAKYTIIWIDPGDGLVCLSSLVGLVRL